MILEILMNRMVGIAAVAVFSYTSWAACCDAREGKPDVGDRTELASPPYLTSTQLAALRPAPRPGDVSSPQALLAALYASVSGRTGSIDWSRLRSLFLPGASVGMVRAKTPKQVMIQFVSADENIDYLESLPAGITNNESILKAHVEQYGNIASAFYGTTATEIENGETKTEAGVSTVSMMFDGKRWWASCLLFNETPNPNDVPDSLKR